VPGADRAHVIKTFAGLRPAGDPAYRIERSRLVPNLVHVAGIRSTGVSSAPAVAELVCRLLGDVGLEAPVRARAVARLPRVARLAELPSERIDSVTDREARAVVCACEHVTIAEIRAACGAPVPATSLAGVRKRTRAMAGRCQGACCQAGVGAILAAERGYVPSQVPLGSPAASGASTTRCPAVTVPERWCPERGR
jgi:glycerol-3-phosphate dehydrogenase